VCGGWGGRGGCVLGGCVGGCVHEGVGVWGAWVYVCWGGGECLRGHGGVCV